MEDGSKDRRRSGAWGRRVLFSLVPICALFLAGELAVRWFSFPYREANSRFRAHRRLRYVLRANYRIRNGGAVHESSNRFGLRGSPDMRREKGRRFRIAAIGDSVTFGLGLADSQTYPAQLERRLNRRAGGPRFEVLNAGLPGYSPIQSRIYFEQRVAAFRPDLVLWQFIEDDVTDVLDYRPLEGARYHLRTSALYWYLTYKWGDLRYRLFILPNRVGGDRSALPPGGWIRRVSTHAPAFPVESPNQDKLRGRPIMAEEIRRLHASARRLGTKVVMVFFPYVGYRASRTIPSTDAWLAELSRREGRNYVSLTRRFIREPAGLPLYLPHDSIHPNTRGYALAAQFLADSLERMGLIPMPKRPRD